jgi:hypothetical protein
VRVGVHFAWWCACARGPLWCARNAMQRLRRRFGLFYFGPISYFIIRVTMSGGGEVSEEFDYCAIASQQWIYYFSIFLPFFFVSVFLSSFFFSSIIVDRNFTMCKLRLFIKFFNLMARCRR